MFRNYRTGELLNYLGVSRDTLRFYEEKGLINPKKNDENNYRGYDINDIFRIMVVDFYKKRGMSINQIQDLIKHSGAQDIQDLLECKKDELNQMIYEWQCMVKRIEETQEFCRDFNHNFHSFTVKAMPRYRVCGEVSDFIAFEEYETVIDIMSSNHDDMISQIMRYISFDQEGVTGTKMLIVEATQAREESEQYIEYPNCLSMVVEELHPNEEPVDLFDTMYELSTEYAKLHGLKLIGEAFALIRLITYKDNITEIFMEIFVPFES